MRSARAWQRGLSSARVTVSARSAGSAWEHPIRVEEQLEGASSAARVILSIRRARASGCFFSLSTRAFFPNE